MIRGALGGIVGEVALGLEDGARDGGDVDDSSRKVGSV